MNIKPSKYNYKHGPLARTVLGQNLVQGIDYAYTLQGWLKGINSTGVGDGSFDMGQDGKTGSVNDNIARDVFGISLYYFTNDYKASGRNVSGFAEPFASVDVSNDLFNGNIKAQVVNIPKLRDAMVYSYSYDQLNRLTKMAAYSGLNNTTNIFTPVSTDNYKEIISYDANGNTQTYLRNNETGAAKNNYNYAYTSGTNKLSSITNSVNSQTKTYNYDAIGNTTEDGMQGITNAVWNVYGKLQSLVNKNEQSIVYNYSSDGQRINKKVGSTEEWYVRDASGNIMATYKNDASTNSGNLTVTEIYKYGSSLLSIKDARINVQNPTGGGRNNFVRGNDNYILTDANGNTKATVSDKKIQHSTDGVTVDYYAAEVRTATLHSTYGANAKTFNGGFLSANFNGQRKSTEIGDDAQTALFWEYNGDVGRRWNVDPKPNKFLSVFACFEDNPIYKIDVLGILVIFQINLNTEKRSQVLRLHMTQKVKITSCHLRSQLKKIKQSNSLYFPFLDQLH